MDPFRTVALNEVLRPGAGLTELGQEAARALTAAEPPGAQSVCVFESSTGGLIQAALRASPGAFSTCGAVASNMQEAGAALGLETLSACRPANGEEYKESMRTLTQSMAKLKRREMGATWCLCESGACGPIFPFPEISQGFTAIFVSGPIERGLVVESNHNDREVNMWGFAKLALDLLAECVKEAKDAQAPCQESDETLLDAKEDLYGGVNVVAKPGPVRVFAAELQTRMKEWKDAGKKGLWLKIPVEAAACVGPAAAQGFLFHHTKPEYVLLTQWLPKTPSPLPGYGFTQVGVGGVVVNSKGEVLMVQEKVNPWPKFQGSWKLPGGMAKPDESFAETALREIEEETGVTGDLLGLVSLRHSHGERFGQNDIYVLVKLKAKNESITMDTEELIGAKWMSEEEMKSRLANESDSSLDGKVSQNNLKVIQSALHGPLIEGTPLAKPNGGKESMLYTAK